MDKTTNMDFTDNYVIISEHMYSITDQVWANQKLPLIVLVYMCIPKVIIWTKLYTDPKIPEYLGTLVEVILSSFNPNYCVCL